MWPAVMRAAAAEFGADNPYGVVAFGIRRKESGGRALAYDTLTVYVASKAGVIERPVPTIEFELRGSAYELQPDVVAAGVPGPDLGGEAVFSGLHPGAPLRTAAGLTGGTGAILGDVTGARFLVTAGHLFGPNAGAEGVFAANPGDAQPTLIGSLERDLLDGNFELGGGMQGPIDLALVRLNSDGAQMATRTLAGNALRIGQVGLVNPISGALGQMFSPLLAAFSGPPTFVNATPFSIHLRGGARLAPYTLSLVLMTQFPISQPGDSGSVLCTTGQNRLGLGACAGRFMRGSVFEPFARALPLLREAAGEPGLRVWRG